jgi:hypothetical protein
MSRLERPSRLRPFVGATVVCLSSLALIQCDRKSEPAAPVQTEAPTASPAPATVLTPKPVTALTRVELVSAAGQAASAYAQGRTPTDADPLVGRSFAVRIPFGCTGPSAPVEGAAADGVGRWSWGPDNKTIQISLTPGDWTGSALTVQPGLADVSAPTWEAVEGFWVPRPWLAAETCPGIQADPLQIAQAAATPQTVGIAAVFETGGSRLGRRNGKAYAFTVRQEGEQPLAAPAGGYRLLLEGRVVGFPEGRALRCRAPGPDQRPVCVVAVQLDKVTFEDASGATLSEWRPG